MADQVPSGRWTAESAWAGIALPGHIGVAGTTGVKALCLGEIGIATLIAPPGDAALADAMRTACGFQLPDKPLIVGQDGVRAVWAGPRQWLLLSESLAGIHHLRQALSPYGAFSDQSGSRALLRLTGPALRQALAKGCMLDLHPSAFAVGAAGLTSIAHIGVHLWRLPDGPDGPVFEIAVARSMVGSFWSWFSASVAEFGCAVSVDS